MIIIFIATSMLDRDVIAMIMEIKTAMDTVNGHDNYSPYNCRPGYMNWELCRSVLFLCLLD